MSESQRNFIIIIAIAVIGSLFFSESLNAGTGAVSFVIGILFRIMLIWFAVTLYMRHSGTIATMPKTPRLVLQLSGVVLLFLMASGLIALVFAIAGFDAAVPILANPAIFWPVLLLSLFGIWWAWQQRTSRW
jgi:hypothetical protein